MSLLGKRLTDGGGDARMDAAIKKPLLSRNTYKIHSSAQEDAQLTYNTLLITSIV